MINKRTSLVLIFSIITTIMSVLVLFFFFRIIENKNRHTSAVILTLDNKISEKENAEILKERIIEIEETYKEINNYLLNQEFIDTFVSYIEDLGESVGAKISVKGIDSVKNEKNLVQIKVYSYGNFSSVLKSISLIENMPYKVDIIQVYLNKDISKDEDTKESSSVSSSNWGADITFNIKSIK